MLGDDAAGLMLTNPNTVGIFDENILEITRLVHEAGGLCYYDGANLNAVMGIVRPGDMGFDVHPHEPAQDLRHPPRRRRTRRRRRGLQGVPGAVSCPSRAIRGRRYAGARPRMVRAFNGNFLVVVKALAYLLTLGREGIPEAAENAVLNANYLMRRIQGTFQPGLRPASVCTSSCWGWRSSRRRPASRRWMWPRALHGPRHPSPHHVLPPHRP